MVLSQREYERERESGNVPALRCKAKLGRSLQVEAWTQDELPAGQVPYIPLALTFEHAVSWGLRLRGEWVPDAILVDGEWAVA